MKKTEHKNIPIFIPHLGCPNDCVFCSQTKITGVGKVTDVDEKEIENVKKTVESSIKTLEKNGEKAEIAFFGGSFTGIGKDRMVSLLKTANGFLGGNVVGIRCSTRPDYIDTETLDILRYYGVTAIELGIQSTDENVLKKSGRGHTAKQSENACNIIKKYGFELGGQMMVGLPCGNIENEIQTAKDIVSFGADTARIYPTVVFKGTKLFDMMKNGEYIPLTNNDGAYRASKCAEIFIKNNVNILRIGLHSSENLSDTFGANHPAIGEITEGKIYYSLISEAIGDEKGNITVKIPCGELSKCIGQHRENKVRIESEIGGRIRFEEDNSLSVYQVKIVKDINIT